jgi:Arc/MetJ family transcription regulator
LIDGGANAVQRAMLAFKQMRGTATPADKQEFQAADKAFGGTAGGMIGDVVTTAAPAVAATFVPGLNTIVGQAAIGGAMGAFTPADSMGERLGNVALGGGIGAAAKYGGDKLANAITGRSAAKAAQLTTQNAERDAAIAASRAAGYTIPPTSANPTLANRALEGFAGKISTAQGAAIKNQPITDSLVRKSLGLADDAPLTRETLTGVRKQAGAAYEAAKNLGKISADDTYLNALAAVAKESDEISKDFAGAVDDKVVKLVDTYLKDTFDSKSAVASLKYLRGKADTNLGPMASAEAKTLGRAQRAIADALEGQLERHAGTLGDDATVQALREARTLIAKSYSVEKALREGTGSVSANKLAQQLSKGKPLSGGLKTAATMGQNFPRAVQDVTSSMPGLSPLDYGAAGGISAITGNPALLGLIAGRPAVRAGILSAPYQRAMVNAPSYGPGLLGRTTPAMLQSPAMRAMLTAGLLGADE